MEHDSERPFSIISLDRPRGTLLVVSGPSGVGKSSVVNGVATLRPVHFSVSSTTRKIRPGEQEGVDYHYLTHEQFQNQIDRGDLLEWAEYGGNRYGTPKAPLLAALAEGAHVVLDIENEGAKQVKAAYPQARLIFLMPPSLETLEKRLRGRGDTAPRDIERRLAVAETQMADAREHFDHLVINDDLDTAIGEVVSILDTYQKPDAPSAAAHGLSSRDDGADGHAQLRDDAGTSGDSPSGDDPS